MTMKYIINKLIMDNIFEYEDIVNHILSFNQDYEKLHLSIVIGNYNIFRLTVPTCYQDAQALLNKSALNGNMLIVKWMIDKGFPINGETYANLINSSDALQNIMWLRDKELAMQNKLTWDYRTTYNAAKSGNLTLLRNLLEIQCPYDYCIYKGAAEMGHIHIIEWAIENNFYGKFIICLGASRGNQLEVLKWARERNYSWSSGTCEIASGKGYFELLKWARENGCEWGQNTAYAAAVNGHLNILKWCIENGCPWNRNKCIEFAIDIDVINWLNEN